MLTSKPIIMKGKAGYKTKNSPLVAHLFLVDVIRELISDIGTE